MSLFTSRVNPLAMQLTGPSGFWSSAEVLERLRLASSADCPPVGENGSALAVTAPVEPGQRAGIHQCRFASQGFHCGECTLPVPESCWLR